MTHATLPQVYAYFPIYVGSNEASIEIVLKVYLCDPPTDVPVLHTPHERQLTPDCLSEPTVLRRGRDVEVAMLAMVSRRP